MDRLLEIFSLWTFGCVCTLFGINVYVLSHTFCLYRARIAGGDTTLFHSESNSTSSDADDA